VSKKLGLIRLRVTSSVLIPILLVCSVFLRDILKKTVNVSLDTIVITDPSPGSVFTSPKIKVRGKTSNTNSRVYLLVHPATTDTWWVQDLPDYDMKDMTNWNVECYIGTKDQGIGDSYDIVALSSVDNIILDALLGRHLYSGENLKTLPVLNKSNIITVTREN
jgi:hypothetical protein